ncbi:MAG: hypothetical protein A3D31_17875 [Candidatus Fluviicola riflensis]|nr:MAG: hypothetical protein CHH17_02815 [Candidatus Fluviicola riflensis]OGS76853.1 MAG: hypothetical protein A3D31_17875 [Candidatus Fluviicola riflensis]OGS81783.1 MAG: hypothetical protein A2724_15275 [Fluviicola sp. RIFCSPHIGHO2_01_FULL_43_53]OGS88582.1 MAG: hypothetical protein A3E30_07385 [Fluviicola sp. RIFCSPHIGHO2_12_FULL_43_24]
MLKIKHIIYLFALVLLYINASNSDYYFSGSTSVTIGWIVVLVIQWLAVLWCDSKIVHFLQMRYPRLDQMKKRTLFATPAMIVSTYLIILITDYTGEFIIFSRTELSWGEVGAISNLIGSFLITIIILPLFEMIFSGKVSQRMILENEELIRRNLQGQYDTLKGQVNPHFLFNSLNSLNSLILKDSDMAVEFVYEMAFVYRYLLKSNEYDKVPIQEELAFAEAYFHLLKTRFGENIVLNIEVPESEQDTYIAPLTLQILIENVVKHNVISTDVPIVIRVTVNKDSFVIENNVRKKIYSIDTTKTGLANIAAKYKLLEAPEIEVIEQPGHFTVKIPLLK